MLTFAGIDLGQKGAITVISELPGMKRSIEVFSFWGYFGGTRLRTATEDELVKGVREIMAHASEAYVAIEHPVFMPRNGKKAIAGLFHNFGFIKGIFHGLSVAEVWTPKPAQWMKLIGASKNKTANLRLARKLYPKLSTLTLDNSDSVLIAEICRKYYS